MQKKKLQRLAYEKFNTSENKQNDAEFYRKIASTLMDFAS